MAVTVKQDKVQTLLLGKTVMNAVISRARLLKRCPPKPVTRFAPSSTGYLHLGHALSLLYVYSVAKAVDARFLLRIENHDEERSKKVYEDAILKDVEWLGIRPHRIVKQSDRPDVFAKAAHRLIADNKAYFCRCSRKDLAQVLPRRRNQEMCYPGRCRDLALPEASEHRLRFRLGDEGVSFEDILCGDQDQDPAEQCGDMLIRDCRGIYTYNFAVVVDDIDQGVNLVVRGEDLLHCTGRQLLLHKALGSEEIPRMLHHPLIMGSDGEKLSKRCASTSISSMREEGVRPEQVIGQALSLIDLCEPHAQLDAMAACEIMVR